MPANSAPHAASRVIKLEHFIRVYSCCKSGQAESSIFQSVTVRLCDASLNPAVREFCWCFQVLIRLNHYCAYGYLEEDNSEDEVWWIQVLRFS
jgi:hypothetical protein